jgi:STE24 endopeptidase
MLDITNPWLIAGFTGLVIWFHVKLGAELLNLSRLRSTAPEPLRDVVTDEDCVRAAEYTLAHTKVDCLQDGLQLGLTLGFWLCGGFSWLQHYVDGYMLGPVWGGVLMIGVLTLTQMLMALPYDLWRTFRIEAAYDLNKTTMSTFWGDWVKGLVLTLLLGAPLLAVLLWFFYSTEWAALWSWATVSVFCLLMSWLAPALIMPLYLKFTPLAEGTLKQGILALGQKLKFPVRDISVVDGSRRSTKANAFFTGIGSTKRIALYDTLLTAHTEQEILAVLAHEIGHARLKHVPQQLIIGLLQSGLLFGLLHYALLDERLYAAFSCRPGDVALGMVAFSIIYGAWSWLLESPLQLITRKHEFQADRFAREAMESAEPMISCLKKLSRDHLAHLTPHPFHVWLHNSHPPVLERIQSLSSRY